VGLPPVAERVEVPTPGDGVDEGCGALVGGDRERDGEVAAGGRDGAPEAALGEVGGRNAEGRETGDLLVLRGEPREVGVLDDVVEGEQAAEEEAGGANAPVADVLDVERPVEGARGDVAALFARASTVRRKGAFTRGRGLEQALHEAMRGGRAATLLEHELGAEEDATVEADEGEPGSVPPGPAERFEGGLAASQVGDGGHGARCAPSMNSLRRDSPPRNGEARKQRQHHPVAALKRGSHTLEEGLHGLPHNRVLEVRRSHSPAEEVGLLHRLWIVCDRRHTRLTCDSGARRRVTKRRSRSGTWTAVP